MIKEWSDTEKYRSEIEPYLRTDNHALIELFFAFNNYITELKGYNITEFYTLSSMCYRFWTDTLKEEIMIFDELEQYEFTRKSIY